ncbi:MAG: iduronate sulfatase [Bacteroides sp. SM23_62]|nr:MAG: iduronate sulfatase [Bacteroides sp. SM23_62]
MLLVALLFSCQSGELPEKPNVLFIAVDDLRPELNCYGRNQIHSPNIDALAAEGLLFQQAYCNIPVCGASRASLMTGIRPTINRFITYYTWADKDAPGITTLPGLFREHGYHTISNGKVFHNQFDSRESWDENWRPEMLTTWRDYQLPENITLDTLSSRDRRGPAWECADGPDSIYFDGQIALKSVRDLEKLKAMDKPFFLAAGFLKPHLPFNATKKYWDLYDPAEISLPGNDTLPLGLPYHLITNWGELRAYDAIPAEGPVSDSAARKLIHGYYACVSSTDAAIGMILDALEELELERSTIVILWGDHGWNLNEHGLWCKHCNFNTSLRTTLMLKVPGKTKGRQADAVVEFIDIYPTLAELCNLPLPAHLEGKSLVPLVEDPDVPFKDFIISKWYSGLTIQTREFAYTEWFNREDSLMGSMLYDHRTDRDENFNLAGLPEYENLADSLSRVMHANKGEDYYK